MKKTTFADQLVFTTTATAGRKFQTDLEVGVDTSPTGFSAWITYRIICSVADADTPDGARIYRIPVTLMTFVPFGAGDALILDYLNKFFTRTAFDLPNGTTQTVSLTDQEALGAMRSELADIVNLVEVDNTSLIDQDSSATD